MTQIMKLSIARTADGIGLALPSYTSEYHMGLNLQLACAAVIRLEPGDRAYVPVGFAIGIPAGYCGYITSNKVLAQKNGVVVADAPAVLSPADRMPVFVLLQNISAQLAVLHRGDMIAQLVIHPAIQVTWNEIDSSVGGKTTPNTNLVQDGFQAAAAQTETDAMVSSKRVYKDARHRFDDEDGEEEK